MLAETAEDGLDLYPRGWSFHRNGHIVYEDDYQLEDSWTALYETQSVHGIERWGTFSGPYLDKVRVLIRLRIYGKRTNGKLRAHRWWAEVEVGHARPGSGFFPSQVGGKCSSVADAIRRAHHSPEVKALVERSIRWTYCTPSRRIVFCRMTSNDPKYGDPPATPPLCEEYLVGFDGLLAPFDHLPPGRYVAFSWRRAFPRDGEPHWRKAVTLYDIMGTYGASSCSPAQHERWVSLFPSWFGPPPEKP